MLGSGSEVDLPGRLRRRSGPSGFAVVVTVALLALLGLVAIGLLSLSSIQVRQSSADDHELEARANARLALMLAIGELQGQLGPDQRVSASATLMDSNPETPEVEGVRHPHWTGVWSTLGGDGKSIWVRDDANGGLRDRRFDDNWQREAEVRSYLVSGNEGGRGTSGGGFLEPGAEIEHGAHVELVGEGSLGDDPEDVAAGRVLVKRVKVDSGRDGDGHYGFWVGDLGVRANIATRNVHEGNGGMHSPETFYEVLASQEVKSELMPAERSPGNGLLLPEEDKARLVSARQLGLLGASVGDWQKKLFHDVTVHSRGIPANVRDGGLKGDLTAYLQGGPVAGLAGDPESGLSDSDRLVGMRNEEVAYARGEDWTASRHRYAAPRFGMLRHWASVAAGQLRSDSMDAILPKPERSPRFPSLNRFANVNLNPATLAELDQTTIAPVLVEGSYMTSLSRHRLPNAPGYWQMRLHVYPRVVLWNPYNTALRFPKSMLMIQGNGRKEYYVRVRYEQPRNGREFEDRGYIWLWSSRGEEIENSQQFREHYQSPYAGNIYFTIPETTIEAGECLAFSCADHMEYDSDHLERNLLSCGVAPDTARNFYFTSSDVSDSLNKIQPVEWWEAPVTWTARNQADDNQMLLKVIGSQTGITAHWEQQTHDFDTLPLASMVSCSLQYGAGKEPRIQWDHTKPVPMEETEWVYGRKPLVNPPDVRSRDGFRLRWFREPVSNELGAGGLKNTPHFQTAPLANWNLRAAYSLRSPWDNIAGDLPHGDFAGGPWFFGCYTRDLFDEEVGWQTQMPVLRKGSYRGNPFGPPQDFSTFQDRYVLFDVPRRDPGVLSLAQFQHAKISELVWHPAYAIGQSRADPRVGLVGTSPVDSGGSGGWNKSAIGWASDRERSASRDEWALFGKALLQDYAEEDNLVYDLSYEVNHALWDEYFLSTGDDQAKSSLVGDGIAGSLPNGRHILAEETRATATVSRLTDFHRAAYHLMADGAFNVNSTSVHAWKALLGSTRNSGYGPENTTPFPRVLATPEGHWTGGNPDDREAWAGYRSLTDTELHRLAENIVQEVKKRGPFLSLSDFVNRRLADDETGMMGPLQAAIEASELNAAFEQGEEFALNNKKELPNYRHPDHIDDASRLEQTLKPSSKAWGAPGYLTQGDVLQVIGPALTARSDTFVIRAYGDSVDGGGRLRARVWCEAVVQRSPEPVRADSTGLNPERTAGRTDFGRRFVVKSFRWLNREEV